MSSLWPEFDIDAGTAPVNTVAPVISGTRKVGSVLSTTDGTWTGVPTPTITYQWKRAATLGGGGAYSNISGATSSSYTLVTADFDYDVKCTNTGTNTNGATSADSNIFTTIAGNFTWTAEDFTLQICANDIDGALAVTPAQVSTGTGSPHGAGEQLDWPELQTILLLT